MRTIKHFLYDAELDNEYLWFPDFNMNVLVRLDVSSLQCECILSFPNEMDIRLYCGVKKIGNKIVFCPNRAKMIAIFDIASEKLEQIKVDFQKYDWRVAAMYGGWSTGDSVYFFRRGYSGIYQLKVNSGELRMLDIVQEEKCMNAGDYFWLERTVHRGQSVILYDRIHYTLYKYDETTFKAEALLCIDENKKLIDFVSDNHFIWILCSNGIIYKLEDRQIIDEYYCNTNESDKLGLYYYKGILFVFDKEKGHIFCTFGDKNEILKIFEISNVDSSIMSFLIVGNKIIIQQRDGRFYFFDGVNEFSAIAESDLSNIPRESIYPNEMEFAYENLDFQIERLLLFTIAQNNGEKYDEKKQCVETGSIIYHLISCE